MQSNLSPSSEVESSFVLALPKAELHAHLSGSITRQCLQTLWEKRKEKDPGLDLRPPIEVMPSGKHDYDAISFFPLFTSYIYHLCNDIESIEYSTLSVLQDFEDDGVVYLELRTGPRAIPSNAITKSHYVETILSCIEKAASSRMKTYLILSIDRRNTAEEAMEVVDLAIKYQARGVVGVDLSGDTSKGDVSLYKDAFARAKAYGLRITIHFAEVPESSTNAELETLLSYEPDRLGHVIHVPEGIKREIIRRKLGLELCLSCNVHAKLTNGGFADHHFGYWKEMGCPIALGTDDVGVFGSPLSNEYLLAARHFDLDKADLVDLVEQAAAVIFGTQEDKDRLEGILRSFKAQHLASGE